MARGDVVLFEEIVHQLGTEKHNLVNGGDVIKLGIIDNTTPPTAADTAPDWSDYSANEVSEAGGYIADGLTLANQSYTEVDGVATFDADNISLAQDVSGFANGYWGILYNSTNVGKEALAFVDLGGPVSEVAGPVAINWNESGIFSVSKVV